MYVSNFSYLPPAHVGPHGEQRQHGLERRPDRPEECHHEDGLAAGDGGEVLRVEREDLRHSANAEPDEVSQEEHPAEGGGGGREDAKVEEEADGEGN